ncbi:MAG TPA: DUF4861 family protein [Longimicrobiaceae bacterium]|nr:DUF4861 family protein [Longimicrobiaceae bacterium]
MKPFPFRTVLPATAAALLAASAAAAPLSAQARLVIHAQNPLDEARRDEVIALPWATVHQRLPSARDGQVRALTAGGQELLTQVLDADGDSRPDSLLILSDFWPNEVRDITIEAAAPAHPQAPRVHVFHDQRRDDIAWENDRIGYRIYGLGLLKLEPTTITSGIDVFSKRTHDMVLETWYQEDLKHGGIYHHDMGQGADMYGVGETLGAGGTAIWKDGTLYRARNFHTQRILANGPIRLVFEVTYDPWNAGGVQVSETKRVTMDAGQNLFRQENTYRFSGAPQVTYAIGTVHRPGLVGGTSRTVDGRTWVSTWGPIDTTYSGGHGDLGTGVVIDSAAVMATKDAAGHYLVLSTARSGQPVVFYTGAGWDDSGDFSGPEDWWAYLSDFSRRLSAPIRVSVE